VRDATVSVEIVRLASRLELDGGPSLFVAQSYCADVDAHWLGCSFIFGRLFPLCITMRALETHRCDVQQLDGVSVRESARAHGTRATGNPAKHPSLALIVHSTGG